MLRACLRATRAPPRPETPLPLRGKGLWRVRNECMLGCVRVFTGSPREPLSPSSVAGARAPVSLDLALTALSLRCDKGVGLWRMRMRYHTALFFIYFYILFAFRWAGAGPSNVVRRTSTTAPYEHSTRFGPAADSASSSFLVKPYMDFSCQAVYMDHG